MAFMTSEHTKQIRNTLKEKFPEFRFSVRNNYHLAVDVSILSGPEDFSDILGPSGRETINHYWIDRNYPTHAKLLNAIMGVVDEGNHDNSDIMTDYHDVGWYVHLEIGKWDRPYKQT